jgi:hypothetical protein
MPRNAGNSGERFGFLAQSFFATNDHEKSKFELDVTALMRVHSLSVE